jgi:tetratricopeptide (TPR) repeat protein
MGIFRNIWHIIRVWDTSVKSGLVLALVLLVGIFAVAGSAPESIRFVLLFSAALVFIVAQGIIMWGNRTMLAPYTQAQHQYLAGDFAAARDTLRAYLDERAQQGKKPDANTLTLLGNTYRQMGQLDESLQTLTLALQIAPTYHFSLYGLGRTLLTRGEYAQASQVFHQALTNYAPDVVWLDAALTHYLLDERQQAYEALALARQKQPQLAEPHRQLMMLFLLKTLSDEQPDVPTMRDWVTTGLPFWEAEAERYTHTPYGQALHRIVNAIRLST